MNILWPSSRAYTPQTLSSQTEWKQAILLSLKFTVECFGKSTGTFSRHSCSMIVSFPGGFCMRGHSLEALNYFLLKSQLSTNHFWWQAVKFNNMKFAIHAYIKSSCCTHWTDTFLYQLSGEKAIWHLHTHIRKDRLPVVSRAKEAIIVIMANAKGEWL